MEEDREAINQEKQKKEDRESQSSTPGWTTNIGFLDSFWNVDHSTFTATEESLTYFFIMQR